MLCVFNRSVWSFSCQRQVRGHQRLHGPLVDPMERTSIRKALGRVGRVPPEEQFGPGWKASVLVRLAGHETQDPHRPVSGQLATGGPTTAQCPLSRAVRARWSPRRSRVRTQESRRRSAYRGWPEVAHQPGQPTGYQEHSHILRVRPQVYACQPPNEHTEAVPCGPVLLLLDPRLVVHLDLGQLVRNVFVRHKVWVVAGRRARSSTSGSWSANRLTATVTATGG